MSTTQLVQIQPIPVFVNKLKAAQHERERAASLEFPKEYTELRSAFEAVFEHLNSRAVCSACFAGKFDPLRKGQGCCSHCPALSTTGCTSKPVACASFARCEHIGRLFGWELHKIWTELDWEWMAIRRSKQDPYGTHPYHIGGYINDSEIKWTPMKRKKMRELTAKVLAVLEDVKAGKFNNRTGEEVADSEEKLLALQKNTGKYGYANFGVSSVYAPDTSWYSTRATA